MDIDLLSDYTEEDLLSFSSHLLSDLPHQLITDTSKLFDADTYQQKVLPVLALEKESVVGQNEAVISKITTITESVIDCLISGNEVLELQVKSRSKQKRTIKADADVGLQKENQLQNIRFPSKYPTEAPRFG